MNIDTTQAHKVTDLDSFNAYVTVGSIVYYAYTTGSVTDTFISRVDRVSSNSSLSEPPSSFADAALWVSDIYASNPKSFSKKSRFDIKDVDFIYSFDPEIFKSLYPELLL